MCKVKKNFSNFFTFITNKKYFIKRVKNWYSVSGKIKFISQKMTSKITCGQAQNHDDAQNP
jgi:hypothetical protein